MADWRVPFCRIEPAGRELEHVRAAVASGHLAGDGPFARRCEALLQSELGVRHALLTSSCTHALEMCALLLDLQPGDQVVVPSFAFVTTAGAFALHGAEIVFADVRRDTLNLDETYLAEHMGPRTRAVVALHYAGVACEMDAIRRVASAAGARVVEDAAHALLGRYRGRPLGTLGDLAALSFHETKNFSCGEGGALLTDDSLLAQRAEVLREKGTDRARLKRGEVDRYTWVDLGSSYLPSELAAAFLWGQLEARDRIETRRRVLWQRYRQELDSWARALGAELPTVPDECDSAFHLFHLLLPSAALRRDLAAHLAARGVLAVFHYLPLHLSDMGRARGGRPGQCPVAEDVAERLLRLPLFHALRDDEQALVIEAVLDFRGG